MSIFSHVSRTSSKFHLGPKLSNWFYSEFLNFSFGPSIFKIHSILILVLLNFNDSSSLLVDIVCFDHDVSSSALRLEVFTLFLEMFRSTLQPMWYLTLLIVYFSMRKFKIPDDSKNSDQPNPNRWVMNLFELSSKLNGNCFDHNYGYYDYCDIYVCLALSFWLSTL